MMRIIIETKDGEEKPTIQPGPTPGPAAEAETGAVAPPLDLAARAAAMGAFSAGPAPPEAAVEGPTPFVQEPGIPETALEEDRGAVGGMSAGAAPDFAAGPLDAQEVEAEGEPGEES
jgi:hypothetical protein